MSNFNSSANMGLPIPVVGVDPGPDYALNLNNCQTIIDSHDHSVGKGVQITPAGLNINSDLSLSINNLIMARSLRLAPQANPFSSGSDVGCLYELGVDLYYIDGNGNQVRITQSGAIVGTPGSISGLTSPASASYNGGSDTFVWQSDVNTPANMDFGAAIFRNVSASSNGVTVQPISGLGSNYTLTLPTVPNVKSIMALDTSGNITAPYTVDNSTIVIASNVLGVPAGGIAPTQIISGYGLVPSGVFFPFGGTAAPSGYLLCDGTSYLQATYPTLFAALGAAYGSADGTHFNVPDMRGMFVRGVTGASANDPDASSRAASNPGGNTGNNVGSQQTDQVGPHTHTANTSGVYTTGLTGIANSNGSTTVTGFVINSNATSETRPINTYANYIIKI